MALKDGNPKDAVGTKKVPMSTVPAAVMAEIGLGMMEGARKYGRHNYRAAGIRASVYYDAALRHLFQWWEGEDIDPDSGLSHITKALATLTVLRDGMITDTWTDDRPPMLRYGWLDGLNKKAGELIEKYPTSAPAHTEKSHGNYSGLYPTVPLQPAQHPIERLLGVAQPKPSSPAPSTGSPAPIQPSPQYIPPMTPSLHPLQVGEVLPYNEEVPQVELLR